tara:strand:+ start:1085 stop:2092 length:1008 start_codon:yes stop_codon:yes gene_type:complete
MKGVLLINLGSPEHNDLKSVKKFLKEFLNDKFVINLPTFIRNFIVNFIIVPFRSRKTLKAYNSIWTEKESPIIRNTNKIGANLKKIIPMQVEVAMRYQKPSIEDALKRLSESGCEEVTAIPLYPHYAMSSSLTTISKIIEINKNLDINLNINFIESFYNHEKYIKALTEKIRSNTPRNMDYLLFSYHGIPNKHLIETDPTKDHCLKSKNCCDLKSEATRYCYKSQVLETSKLCSSSLDLQDDEWGVSFQSRLWPGWIKPWTDEELEKLPKLGKKNIAIVCPAFIADNLETLEEIKIRGENKFLDAGGETFTYIPCLNSNSLFLDFLKEIVNKKES